MPAVYEPKPLHHCLVENKFDSTLNRYPEHIAFGTIWQCPQCMQNWLFVDKDYVKWDHAQWAKISQRRTDKLVKQYKKDGR